jgi:hypothetical protein
MIFPNTPDLTLTDVKSVAMLQVSQQIWEERGLFRDKRPRDGTVFGLHRFFVCVLGGFPRSPRPAFAAVNHVASDFIPNLFASHIPAVVYKYE